MRLVIIPAKNEEKSIRQTMKQLIGFDFVVCDGGSTDKTKRIASQLARKVIESNGSYTTAVLDGFRYGLEQGYRQMIVFDCESHTFKDIVPYLDCGAEIIAGKREKEKKAWYRKMVSSVGRRLSRNEANIEIEDTSNGFRAYSWGFVRFILSLRGMESIPSYLFNTILAFYSEDFKVKQFPMSYIGGKSGLNFNELLRAYFHLLSFKKQEKPLDWDKVTHEEVVSFLKLYYGYEFESFIRRRQ